MVKDKMKESYGRPYFVCSDRTNPCSFWYWADVFEGIKPFCRHDLVCRMSKVKKEGPNQGRLFHSCPNDRENSCGFFEWKQKEDESLFPISVTFSFLLHPRTDIQSKVPERLSPVMKPIIKRPTKNSFTKTPLTNWLKI